MNRHFHKNCTYNEIKHHHYVISFDPSDKTERGLTGEKAQALGLEFATKNFPGHQALVVTHTDGHNHSGNIHVHIVINSVRKFSVEREDSYQPLPTIAEIREQKADLESRKEKLLKNYEYYRDYEKDLRTVMANVDAILDVRTVGRQKDRDVEVL